MKITSRASDYGLSLLIHLSSTLARPADETMSVKRAAAELKISLRFLANIANKLAIARILTSHRGSNGGMGLARPSDRITVREVIEAIDGPVQTMFCQNTEEVCTLQIHCHMKHFWDEIQATVMKRLNTTTIADLAAPRHVPLNPLSERRPS